MLQSEEKKAERKDISDTKKELKINKGDLTDPNKKLDIRKGDLTDPNKKLDIRKGDLTDTKKWLRKTSGISNSQISFFKRNLIKAVGNNAYTLACTNSPNLVRMRMKYDWLKFQVEEDQRYWKGREKREIESKKKSRINIGNTKDKKNKKSDNGLSEIRQKDYEKRFSKYEKQIDNYNSQILSFDKEITSMKGRGKMSTQLMGNSVGDKGARLTDKFGNYKITLNKGEQVETKDSKLDGRYYEVRYKDKFYYGLKEYFLK